MPGLSSSPRETTILKLEARKSFSFAVHLRDSRDNPIDLSGCVLTFTRALVWPLPYGVTELPPEDIFTCVGVVDGPAGFARFDLQADDLLTAGEFPFTVVMRSEEGYSRAIVKGVVQLQPNTEIASEGFTYVGEAAPGSLLVRLQGQSIHVDAGPMLPPNAHFISDEEKAKLDAIVITDGDIVVELDDYATKVQAQAWDAAVLAAANAYTNAETAEALNLAQDYTDDQLQDLSDEVYEDLAYETNARILGDATTLASAKTYTDGLVLPKVPTPGADLNLAPFLTDGLWYINSLALALTILNLPVPPLPASGSTVGQVRAPSQGVLEVHVVNGQVIQEFTMIAPNGTMTRPFRFLRIFGNSIWGAWLLQSPAISTSSELQQDTVAKMLNATPTSPVSIRRTDQTSVIPYTSTNGDTWTSDSGTPVSAPNWAPAPLNTGISQYGGAYLQSRSRRTASGIVLVSGLVVVNSMPASGVIATLAVGHRPAHKLMFIVVSSLGGARVDVYPNGDIVAPGLIAPGGAVGFLSFAGIQFPSAEMAPDAAWTPFTYLNSFYDYRSFDTTWPVAGYWVDTLGRYWFRGLVGRAGANPGVDLAYAQLPAGAATNKQIHFATMASGGFGSMHAVSAQLVWKSGSSSPTWFSAPQHPIMPVATFPESSWLNLSLLNSWVNFDVSSFPPGSVLLAPDGIVHVRGLIRAGSGQIALLGGGGIGHTTAAQAIWAGNSNQAYARTDIGGNSMVANVGSNAWWSLDNIIYLRES